MTTYRIENTIVKVENATASWDEAVRWDGRNHVSVATGSQWEHETLYRSRKGRYWLEHSSQWEGSVSYAEWLSPQGAARWLLLNLHELPDDLQQYAEDVCE